MKTAGILFTTALGAVIGGAVGWLNRPTYFGGLYQPTADDLTKSNRLATDAVGTVITYALVGLVLGLVFGATITMMTKTRTQ